MAHLLIMTQPQKAVVSYSLITLIVLLKTRKYLYRKFHAINKKLLKQYFVFWSSILFSIYIYQVSKNKLLLFQNYLVCDYLLKILNFIEFLLVSFIFKLFTFCYFLTLSFGYYFYAVFVSPIVRLFYYLLPNLSLELQNFFLFFIITIRNTIVDYFIETKNLFSHLNFQYVILLINTPKLLHSVLFAIEFLLLIVEYVALLLPVLIIPPIRIIFLGLFSNSFQNWDYKKIQLTITDFITRWLNQLSKKATLIEKFLFVLITLIGIILYIFTCIKFITITFIKVKNVS